jgi:ER lumen protein retaining receptor
VSLYNTVMKLIYIAASAYIVRLIRVEEPYKSTYEAGLDTYLHWKFAVGPALALACIFNEGWSHWHGFTFSSVTHFLFEISWAFSLYLEAIAILPQLILLQRHNCVENLTSWYMASLGVYRGLYVINWIVRWWHNEHISTIALLAGIVQTAFYADFLYYFVRSKAAGSKIVVLPT